MKKTLFLYTLLITLFMSCGEDSEGEISTSTSSDDYLIEESMFGDDLTISSFEVVTSTFSDGSSAEFYEIKMLSDGINVDGQEHCPTKSTTTDFGGLAIYDGSGDDILYPIGKELFDSMEAHGFDIVDNSGNVYVYTGGAPGTTSVCADLSSKYDLELTYLIPVNPTNASSVYNIGETETMGTTLDGVHIVSDPPSISDVNAGAPGAVIPALDRCGGHPDNTGYYHLHFIPEVINQVLTNNGITEVSCTLYSQLGSGDVKLVGFAKDGYPIYAYETMPSGLDECNGITAVTPEYPDGIYHYVASTTDYLNIPPCLKGKFSANWLTLDK